MSDEPTVPIFTIQVGSSATFSNQPNVDISSKLNAEIGSAPSGDEIVIDFEPGVYGVVEPIRLPSNTTVIGDDTTLQPLTTTGWEGNTGIFVNADAYSLNSTETYVHNVDGTSSILTSTPSTTTVMDPLSSGVIDTNISVQGITFNDTGHWTFGTWFINAKDIDVQNNTYIGGPDGNAFVDVVDGIVANNIAVGQVNASYDNWDGPTNITIENNSAYIGGTSESGWSVLINACPSGNPLNPGNASNDGVIGNEFSGYWADGSSGNADPLENYGFTTESDITQQGNLISGLDVPKAGSFYSANVVAKDVIQDDLFTGINYPSSDTSDDSFVIGAFSNSETLASNAQILGNLILGAYNGDNGASLIVNIGNSPITENNAILGDGSDGNEILTKSLNGSFISTGNITTNGKSICGAGVTPQLDVLAPANILLSPGSSEIIPGLTIEDPFLEDSLTVTVSAIFGSLSLPSNLAEDATWETIDGEQSLILTGLTTSVNDDLNSLSYTSPSNGWDDSIEVTTTDAAGFSATRYIPVSVTNTLISTDELKILPAGFFQNLPSENSLYPGATLLPEPSSLNGEIAIASSGDNVINMGSTISASFLGTGSNTVIGGSNQGYIVTGSGNSSVNLTGGGDITVAAGSGLVYVDAAAGNDLIEAGSSTATILAGSGSDTIVGGLGNTSITGGDGPLYVVCLPQDGGNTNIQLGTNAATVFALSGNSFISTQSSTSNTIYTGIGSSTIQSSGSDVVSTGSGPCIIYASASATDQVFQGLGPLNLVCRSSYVSTVMAGGGDLTLTTSGDNVFLDIAPVATATRTITLDSLSAGVSLCGGLSVKFESFNGDNTTLLLSDGTNLTLLDPQGNSIIDLAGQLTIVTNVIYGNQNSFVNLNDSYSDNKPWSIVGALSGSDTINSDIPSVFITTSGANNLVGLSGANANVISGGDNDLITGFGGEDLISVTGVATDVLIRSSEDTIYAAPGSASFNAFFFGLGGGQLDFINQSSSTASVTGGADGASGSVTVFGGAGGGYYQGGTSGNNWLIGGSGNSATTLIGAGTNSLLSVGGSGNNALFTGDGNATLLAGNTTTKNIFSVGMGTDIVSSCGSTDQNYFFEDFGSDTIYGSTVTGATNNYFFSQTSSTGGGTAVIFNFSLSRDSVYINLGVEQNSSSVDVQSIYVGNGGSTIYLNNNTSIVLEGLTLTDSQQLSIVGGSRF